VKAVVWRGDRTLEVETVEDAHIEATTDILMSVTSRKQKEPVVI
jgi:hypothetical protein